MKRIILVLILLTISVAAQENNKGKVSLIFNGEKIELPITMVSLKKENVIVLSMRAEKNGNDIQQLVSFQLGFKKLSSEDKYLEVYDDFLLNVINKRAGKNEEILFRMIENATDGELTVKKGNRTWNLASFGMKLNIEKVSFENSHIIIKGSLSFKARDKNSKTPLEPVSEIEDCKFEIII